MLRDASPKLCFTLLHDVRINASYVSAISNQWVRRGSVKHWQLDLLPFTSSNVQVVDVGAKAARNIQT